ncbi:MAG TPA: hypothetical protein VHL53_13805 [Acidimicrobiia bacterium]|nr:hypothetical protein [Acidimicrobiia bacterium]
MRPSPRPRPAGARLAGAGLAALLLAGCVHQDAPGVGIQKLAADIVFGVKPAADTAPPNLAPGPVSPGDATTYVPGGGPAGDAADFGAGDFSSGPGGSRRLPRVTPLTPSKVSCPPAALTAFPAKEAGLTVEGLPAEGQYRWKRSGSQTVANLPGVKLPVSGFEQRLVRNVKKISDKEYTFETVQPELSGSVTTISTFKVKVGAVNQAVSPPVKPPDPTHPTTPVPLPAQVPGTRPATPAPQVPETVSVGDPERGISLTKLQRVDAAGNMSELTFNPAVLYLPLEIVPGESFNSIGIDPRTGSVLQNQGKVIKRQRVDACGDVVDGWAVEATQTFSGPGETAPPRSYRYIIAPQLGGLIISEELHTATPAGTTDVVLSLGQLRPSPLPAVPAQEPKK